MAGILSTSGQRTQQPTTTPARPKRRVTLVVEPVKHRTWQDRLFDHWELSATGLGVSLGLHAVALIVLSLILLHEHRERRGGLVGSIGQESQDVSLEDSIDTKLDAPAPASELQFVEMPMQPTELALAVPDFAASDVISGKSKGGGDGNGSGEGEGLGAGIRLPVPKSAVSKGSFTVWTVPEDPEPWQKYKIIIQVKLPSGMERYRKTDLAGMMIGSDGYRQTIPDRFAEFTVQDGVAYLTVDVPGAAVLVRDRIEIRSKRLRETQTLELVF